MRYPKYPTVIILALITVISVCRAEDPINIPARKRLRRGQVQRPRRARAAV